MLNKKLVVIALLTELCETLRRDKETEVIAAILHALVGFSLLNKEHLIAKHIEPLVKALKIEAEKLAKESEETGTIPDIDKILSDKTLEDMLVDDDLDFFDKNEYLS